MGIKDLVADGKLKVWDDVLDPSQDGKSAPSVWEIVLGGAPAAYRDSREFFQRTYFTTALKNVLEGVANRLGKSGQPKDGSAFTLPNVVMLASRYGGGKTHTLISLLHAYTEPESLLVADEELAKRLERLKDVQVVTLDCDSKKLVPHPLEPYAIENFRIATIWGMLAYRLGEYARIRHLDNGEKPVPDPDTLKELLKGKRVLILMDEIVKYAFNMQRSAETKNYGEKVITFIENLAKAVENTNSVLIVAVQADYKKGSETTVPFTLSDFTPDSQYKEQAERIISALRRMSPAIIVPVSYDDISQVLRRKIFEKIPDESASDVQSEFYSLYREHQGIFGVEGKWDFATPTRIFSIKETYPFHPKYIEVLSDFVTRNKDLQRTRDAVNITRKVVRNLVRSDENPHAIMPYHIDLRLREVRDNTITESYAKEFDPIVVKDIVSRDGTLGNVRSCSKPELAYAIANVVLLKTFTYETFKEALHVFPDLTDVALMVYEPNLLEQTESGPTDIQDLLGEMPNRLDHFVTDKGRYWFSPYRSVKEIIDKMAETMVREERPTLFHLIEEVAKTVVTPSVTKAREYQPLVLTNCKSFFVTPRDDTSELSIPNDDKMKLVVFLKQPSTNDVENVILRSEGSPRLRVNTIAAVCPDPNKKFEDLLLFAAKILACRRIADNLKEYYSDQDIRSLQQKKLNGYREENEFHVREGLLSTLTLVAFPAAGPSVKTVSAQKAPSLIEQVERALNSAPAGYKIRERIDFDDLKGYLKNSFEVDVVDGQKPVDFRYILDNLFFAKAEAPFVSRSQVEQAVRQGLRTFDIGLRQEGKLYWKKVGTDESDQPSTISERSEILPYKLAANEMVESLLKQEGRVRTPEGHVLETRFYVKILTEERPLSAIASQRGYEDTVKANLIIKRETRTERGFDVELEESYVEVKPHERERVKYSVEGVGDFSDFVELKPTSGMVQPARGKPPFEGVWEIGTFDRPGSYKCILSAKSGSLSRDYELTVNVQSEFKVFESETIELSMSGSQLLEIRPSDISGFRLASGIMDKLGLEGRSSVRVMVDGKITFEATEVNPSLCSFLLQKFDEFRERYTALISSFEYSGTISLAKPLQLESKSIANIQTLNGKAKFMIQIAR